MIFDSQAAAPDLPTDPVLRFHGVHATDLDDAIDGFGARCQVAANAVTISSWDPSQLLAPNAELPSSLDAGELPPLPVYDGSDERIASAGADGHAELMLRALELDNKLFEGGGAVRRLAPGCRFELARNWGSQFTPRIGTEVLVDFIENDIDRPLVVAQLYTGADVPPFSAGVDCGANHAGTISGIHTQGFDGAGYNQWQLDDTRGQLRMRLATSSARTQLNLGYLIAQSPGGAQRGSGFELRTVIRELEESLPGESRRTRCQLR